MSGRVQRIAPATRLSFAALSTTTSLEKSTFTGVADLITNLHGEFDDGSLHGHTRDGQVKFILRGIMPGRSPDRE